MKSVVAFWFKDSDSLFRDLPLLEVREHAERHGFLDTELHYLCMGGDDLGCELARRQLDRGCSCFHDVRGLTQEIAVALPWLRERTGRFFNCFLRWLVVERFAAGEPVLAWDADIFFNVPLSTAERLLDGRTGTASSTCFAVVSDPGWFRIFRGEFERFEHEQEQYLRNLATAYACLVRAGSVGFPDDTQVGHKLASLVSDSTGNALFDYSPEEVFVDRLIRAGTLPHDWFLQSPEAIVCPQLLTLPDLHWTTGRKDARILQQPLRLAGSHGQLSLNGTPLLFVHFQGALFRLCVAHLIAAATPDREPGVSLRLKSILYSGTRAGTCAESVVGAFAASRRRIDRDQPPLQLSIAAVARRFFLEGSVAEVLNDRTSDHEGLWTPTATAPLPPDRAGVAYVQACARSCSTRPPLVVVGTDRSARLLACLYAHDYTIVAHCDASAALQIDGLPVITPGQAAALTAVTILLSIENNVGLRAQLLRAGFPSERLLVAAPPSDLLCARARKCTECPPLIVAGTDRPALLAARIFARERTILAFCHMDSVTQSSTFDDIPVIDLPTAAAVREAKILLPRHESIDLRARLIASGVGHDRFVTAGDATSGLVIFGTGEGGEQAWSCLESPDQVVCFADNDPNRRQARFHEKEVVDPLTLPAIPFRAIVLASMHAPAMRAQLLDLGVPPACIIDLPVPLS